MGAALPRIRTDPTHLRQILVNLLGNAVKYTNEGGIVIRTRLVDTLPDSGPLSADRPSYPTNPWIGIQVIDTGIGIQPADQSRIFEEFEQIDAGPRGHSAERGTGLALDFQSSRRPHREGRAGSDRKGSSLLCGSVDPPTYRLRLSRPLNLSYLRLIGSMVRPL